MTDTPLVRVLGLTAVDGLVPLAGTASWTGASRLLRDALREVGTHTRIRTPTRLWALLHSGPMPPGLSWRRLLADATVGRLAAAVAPLDQAASARIACWNLRSTRALHTTKSEAKRGVLHAWLRAGRTVLLQETHWLDGDRDAQAALFPACTVHSSSPPRTGAGQAGGVAIVVPAPGDITREYVLIPGYAIAADIRTPEMSYRAVSVYLPPDRSVTMSESSGVGFSLYQMAPPYTPGATSTWIFCLHARARNRRSTNCWTPSGALAARCPQARASPASAMAAPALTTCWFPAASPGAVACTHAG